MLIDVANQKIKDVEVETNKRNVEIENIITNIDGTKISPNFISFGGKYDQLNNKVIWSNLSNGINKLEYRFLENINLSNGALIQFSGVVNKDVVVKINSYTVNNKMEL
ncbi:Ig-like domain-containing protein [Clostridium tertium]|uniref:Ig-like domain-containing protein n=1 Tax=Clostridium tertium TaxID=1559 RepID=UPI00374E3C0F